MLKRLVPIAVTAAVLAAPATGATHVRPFEAQFSDRTCGQEKFCGTGTVAGFGRVTSELVLGSQGAGPAAGCFAGKGTRTLTLASDAGSALRLAVQGAVCGARSWGTFKVVSGTGAFAGAAGSGVIWGPVLSLRYFGVLTLSK
jgi:hypothetical protein